MRKLNRYVPVLLAVAVLWKFEYLVQDTLEIAPRPEGPWSDYTGDYLLNEAKTDYLIRIESSGTDKQFFRVRRVWGEPRIPFGYRPAITEDNTAHGIPIP